MEIIYLASLRSIHSLRWINFFSNLNGFKIICISLSKINNSNIKNIKTYYLNGERVFQNTIRSIFLLRSKKKCLLHIHYLGWHSLFVLFANKRKKIILTPWGCDLYENQNNILKRIWLKYLFMRCEYIICDSQKLLEASYKLGYKKNKSKIIAFGTNTKEFICYRKSFESDRKTNAIYIGTNRNMESIYDPLTLLKAANHLKNKETLFKFIIANDGPLKSKIKEYIKENNLESFVNLIGKTSGDENIDFYNSIDIYVSTSLRDGGLSASIAEAMSCERLVIVSDNSDNSKFIQHGISGYLFENKNYSQLASLIEKASKNKFLSTQIASKGRNVIVEKCNFHKEMGKVAKIYKQIYI